MKHLNISNPRLNLLPFTASEAAIFHQINIHPFVRQYLWDDEAISLDLARDILAQNEKHFKEDHFGIWKIILKETNEILGYTGLWYFFDEPQPQLIYALLKQHTGKGFATEAARLIINYAFTKLSFQYLIAATNEPHIASQKVAERLGMNYVETRLEEDKPTLFYRIDKFNAI